MNYINLLSNLDESLCIITKKSLISIFETMNKTYINTIERNMILNFIIVVLL